MTPSDRTILACPSCGSAFQVTGDPSGRIYECAKCGMRLETKRTSENRPQGTGEKENRPEEVRRAAEEAGRHFGKYILIQEVGAGGFGAVWKAWQEDLGRFVALKFLHSEHPEDVQRFLRESQTAAKLHHPNIVPVFEAGEYDGRHYVAMEFIEGQTLEKLRIDPKRAVELMKEVSEAVHYAHEQGIVHRDLKPQNLMLDSNPSTGSGQGGRVWVMDFGLARTVREGTTLTLSGALMGTPSYMSPEQAEGKKADERSDVYGLGATLYELLTGHPPFEGVMYLDVMEQVRKADPRAPRSYNPKIPAEVETIVLKSLEKDPGRRYATAGEFAADLGRHLSGEVILAKPVGPWVRAIKWGRRHPVAMSAALMAAIALMMGGLGVWKYTSDLNRSNLETRRRARQLEVAQYETNIRDLSRTGGMPLPEFQDRIRKILADLEGIRREYPDLADVYLVMAHARHYLADERGIPKDLDMALALDKYGPVGANSHIRWYLYLSNRVISFNFAIRVRPNILTLNDRRKILVESLHHLQEALKIEAALPESGARRKWLRQHHTKLELQLPNLEGKPAQNPTQDLQMLISECRKAIREGGDTLLWLSTIAEWETQSSYIPGLDPEKALYHKRESVRYNREAIQQSPYDPYLRVMLILSLWHPPERDLTGALEELDHLIQGYPEWDLLPDMIVFRGHIQFLNGRPDRALEDTTEAMRRGIPRSDMQVRLLTYLTMMKRFPEALSELEQFDGNDSFWNLPLRKADIYLMLGRFPEALQECEKMKSAENQWMLSSEGLYVRAMAYWKSGDRLSALADLRRAQEIDATVNPLGGNPAQSYSMGRIHAESGQWQEAIEAFSLALKLKSEGGSLHDELLWLFVNRYDPEPEDFTVPLPERKQRMWARVYFDRGRAYEKLGKSDESGRDFAEAKKLDPTEEYRKRCAP